MNCRVGDSSDDNDDDADADADDDADDIDNADADEAGQDVGTIKCPSGFAFPVARRAKSMFDPTPVVR